MRMHTVASAAAVTGAIAAASLIGPLDPPAGPVSSTHKTLTEVEPRTPIDQSQVPVVISLPGSYYLTENLNAVGFSSPVVRIAADHVTLDMQGFTIDGLSEVAAATAGIEIGDNIDNIAIHDGSIIECLGPGVGIEVGAEATVTLERLRILDNDEEGIFLPSSFARVIDCTIQRNGDVGMFANVLLARGCMVSNNGDIGIGGFNGLVQSNVAIANDVAEILMLSGTVIENHAP